MVCSRSALTPVGSREHAVEEVHNRHGHTGWLDVERGGGGGGGGQAGQEK
jgi:hypothetical protein